MAGKRQAKLLYSVHPGVAMVQKWIGELPAKTGRSLEEWMTFIQKKGPKSEPKRRDWLKDEFGMGTNTAWWLAERSVGKGGEDGDPAAYLQAAEKYVEEMFAGKPALRPIYDKLLLLGLGWEHHTKLSSSTGWSRKFSCVSHSMSSITAEFGLWVSTADE